MKFIIMAGGNYDKFKTPKQLLEVNGEVIIERTIRLLKKNGVKDIYISTDNPAFDYLWDIPKLKHNNSYKVKDGKLYGHWCDAFYPTNDPTCYIFGDVYYSDEAIKTIIETETEDIELFGSAPPFAYNYPKQWIEPFALKVVDTDHLKKAIQRTKELDAEGKFWRTPIMWELWTVIKDTPLQTKPDEYIYNYTAINDYTSDIDNIEDVIRIENCLKLGGEIEMIKVKALREFTYGNFNKIKNLERHDKDKKKDGTLYAGDTFECTEEMTTYLTGGCGYVLVKIIEVKPEEKIKVEEAKDEEIASKPKTRRRSASKNKK